MDLINKEIEIEEEVFKALFKYCNEKDLSINGFIKANLEALGEY
jgi:hypothetical protein